MALDKPRKFGKYLLLDRISVGGMAEVYRAKVFGAAHFEKLVAIKRILPALAEDKEFIKMFIDEAKIAGQLDHPNIARIYELGRVEGHYFIAMEYVWGKNLREIMARFQKQKAFMNPYQAAFITSKICEGLDYAHRKTDVKGRPLGIVHRDVTPQNILISYEGDVKLIDFGIAKARDRSSHTAAGVLKGKFAYMSPEQVRGLPLDRRSDIFSIGILLYEMLTSTQLFGGNSDLVVLEKVRNVEVPNPRDFNPRIPKPLVDIMLKALQKDPDSRYQWASEMQEDLERFLMTARPFYTSKRLGMWMKKVFAREMKQEKETLHKLIMEWEKEQAALSAADEEAEEGATVIMDDEDFPEEGEATVILNPYDEGPTSPYEVDSPETTRRELPPSPPEDEEIPEGATVMLDDEEEEGATVLLDEDDPLRNMVGAPQQEEPEEGATVILDDDAEVSIPGIDRPSFAPKPSDEQPEEEDVENATVEVGKIGLDELIGDARKEVAKKLYLYAGTAAVVALLIGAGLGLLLGGGRAPQVPARLVLYSNVDAPVVFMLDDRAIKAKTGLEGAVVEVKPGVHSVKAEAEGYISLTKNVSVREGDVAQVLLRLKRKDVPIEVVVKGGEGVTIAYKDRHFKGRATLRATPGQTVEVILEKLGYLPATFTFTIPPDAKDGYEVKAPKLKPDPLGQVRIESTPKEAMVMYGAKTLCRTPCTVRGLNPSLKHQLQIRKAGYEPAEVEVLFPDPSHPVAVKTVTLKPSQPGK